MEEFCYVDDDGKQWQLPWHVNEQGIVSSSCNGHEVGYGVVLVLTKPWRTECLMVRKAPRPGYENSGMWAFPGGMVRQDGESEKPLEQTFVESLRRRVNAEAGLELATLVPLRVQTPLVTKYTAKGLQRYTLVSPLGLGHDESKGIQGAQISCNDGSVTEVNWIDPREQWGSIGPANRIFAARALWPVLCEEERRQAEEKVEEARRQCNRWASEVGLHQTRPLAIAREDTNPALVLDGPENAARTIVLAHGRDVGMDSAFLTFFSETLASHGYRVVRFEFPYMSKNRAGGQELPDRKEVLCETWKKVVKTLGLRDLVIAGKSLGGLIASFVADEIGVSGLVCLGFPFHREGDVTYLTGNHLQAISTRTLVVQGTEDQFGNRTEVSGYRLSPGVQLRWIEDSDHDYNPPTGTCRTQQENWAAARDHTLRFLGSR